MQVYHLHLHLKWWKGIGLSKLCKNALTFLSCHFPHEKSKRSGYSSQVNPRHHLLTYTYNACCFVSVCFCMCLFQQQLQRKWCFNKKSSREEIFLWQQVVPVYHCKGLACSTCASRGEATGDLFTGNRQIRRHTCRLAGGEREESSEKIWYSSIHLEWINSVQPRQP